MSGSHLKMTGISRRVRIRCPIWDRSEDGWDIPKNVGRDEVARPRSPEVGLHLKMTGMA